MVNIGALDVVISMVVVLILLSLVVQSFQQLVKKVLKLKSRTIESSLADLLGKVVTPIGGGGGGAAAAGTVPGKALVAQVVDELKGLGRRSLFNSPMLDSIAKDDVLKVLTKIGAEAMYPKYQEKFLAIQQALDEVAKALGESQGAAGAGQAAVLTGSSSAKLAALEQALAPLAHDLSALIDQGGMVKAKAVLGDLLNVRRVQMQDLFTLLGEVQDRVQADIAAAQAAGKDTAGLQAVPADIARHLSSIL